MSSANRPDKVHVGSFVYGHSSPTASMPEIHPDMTFAPGQTRDCDCSGWQHHPVCARKYHFIIPAHATPEAAAVHGNIPALVELWMQGSCKKPLRLPQYLADDAG